MESTDVIKRIENEFNQPLKNGENRKIIFWNDYNCEFSDTIDEINIEGVKVHKLTETNNFYTKYQIEEEDSESNYLVYNTVKIEDDKDNWLLDMMIYSDEFYADKTSLIMKELNIDVSLRKIFNEYKVYFNAVERRNRFEKYEKCVDTEGKLKLTILGALCNSKTNSFEEILKVVLMESLDENNNKYYLSFQKYNMKSVFWDYAKFKYGFDNKDKALKKLFIYIVSTVLGNYINEEKLQRISNFIGKNKPNCVIFIDHWMNHKSDFIQYDMLSEEYEKEANIAQIINELDIDDIKDIDILKVFDRAIIKNIVDGLESKIEDYDKYIEIIRRRRTKHFYSKYESIYEALLNAVEMHKFYKKYNFGIPQKNSNKLFNDYVKEYYKMDTYYRKFYYFYDLQPESNVINRLKILVENLYVNWYMTEVGANWSYSIDDDMRNNWGIPGIVNQEDFYMTYINNMISSGDRVFVIISDALRYEVGVEIADKLNEEVINSTTTYAMLSTVPSITKLGMASLLPHTNISINEDGRVSVDDVDSSGIDNRNKILKSKFENSIAVDYQKLPKNKIEFLELLKGYKLVYIYHDTIDATADKGATEIYTFEAVQKAIGEIIDLIHKITDWLGGINVLVTADHGFIYQRSDLAESDKISKEEVKVIDKNRRSFITQEDKNIDNLIKIDMNYLLKNSNLKAYMPKSNIRFKVQGEGSKFVHGGATLQEMVVPVVSFKNIRTTYKHSIKAEKVKVKLTNEVRKITNSIFTLSFFQTESVSEKIIPVTLEVYMIDETNNVISNIETIIADKENDRPEERIFKIKLILKAMIYEKNKKYNLIIKDKELGLILEELPFSINLGIASDYDF